MTGFIIGAGLYALAFTLFVGLTNAAAIREGRRARGQ